MSKWDCDISTARPYEPAYEQDAMSRNRFGDPVDERPERRSIHGLQDGPWPPPPAVVTLSPPPPPPPPLEAADLDWRAIAHLDPFSPTGRREGEPQEVVAYMGEMRFRLRETEEGWAWNFCPMGAAPWGDDVEETRAEAEAAMIAAYNATNG